MQTQPELRFLPSTDIRGAPNTERLSTDYRDYDIAADGRIAAAITLTTSPQYRVILNWLEELRQRLPTQ